jgi:hypothetical protein
MHVRERVWAEPPSGPPRWTNTVLTNPFPPSTRGAHLFVNELQENRPLEAIQQIIESHPGIHVRKGDRST